VRRPKSGVHPEDSADAELIHRVKAAVIARLGEGVDAALLDSAVKRAVDGTRRT
jgi:hypothetical protein